MVNAPVVGYRFRPTDVEIVDNYLRPKNLDDNTSHVDRVISTVNICSFDPWDLPSQSIMKSRDQVWYFFGRKENKYNRGDRQIRKAKSGFWKKTGKPVIIKRKRGNREKIGEKWVLVFHLSKLLGGSKTKWVMHEYHATPPNQMMMTYTICKVKFKGEESEISSFCGGEIEHSHSLITQRNNSGGLSTGSEGTSFECLQSQEVENPRQFSDLDVFEETQRADVMRKAISNLSTEEWDSLLNNDDYEQRKIMFMQEDRNDHRPKQPLTGVFIAHSSDDDSDSDSDSDSISATTGSIQTSSTCDSFGSSNHRVDQITELQESPNSTIKLSQKVNQTLGQETEIEENKLGQEKTKNKRAGFFYRIIQRFIKKIQLCTSI